MMRNFTGICVITPDVTRMRRFFEDVLLIPTEGDDVHAVVIVDGAMLAIFSSEGMDGMAPGSMRGAGTGSHTLEIRVDDVDREYERLQGLGVTIINPPTTYPWGRRALWFRDPDGNIINFHMPAEV